MYTLYTCYQSHNLLGANSTLRNLKGEEDACSATVHDLNNCIEGVLGGSAHPKDDENI
jgi:hypothetical protein